MRRLSSAVVVFVLIANAFDGCLTDPGTAAAAMACCKHQRHDCANALEARDCCQTRNAGTRIADASTLDVPAAAPQPPTFFAADLSLDMHVMRGPAPSLPAPAAESPPPSPPRRTPLRI